MSNWIALIDFEGRLISWTKSDSTEQKRVPGDDSTQDFAHDLESANKHVLIRNMEKRQVVVFNGPDLW
jgi:hypothetical protein